MQTINERAGFLCNFEILAALKEQRDARAVQIKVLNTSNLSHTDKNEEKGRIQPENLHTVTFECIKYLEEEVHPLRRQTATSITTALNDLEKLDLTKSERLQIINLAPTNLCELTVCVEDCEIRFDNEDARESLLAVIKASSSSTITAASGTLPKLEKQFTEEELDMEDHQEEEEEEEFVNEGLAGEGEANVRELDEGE